MSMDTEVVAGWLSGEDLDSARERLPIVYVEAVPVRVDERGEVREVGLLLRVPHVRNLSMAALPTRRG